MQTWAHSSSTKPYGSIYAEVGGRKHYGAIEKMNDVKRRKYNRIYGVDYDHLQPQANTKGEAMFKYDQALEIIMTCVQCFLIRL